MKPKRKNEENLRQNHHAEDDQEDCKQTGVKEVNESGDNSTGEKTNDSNGVLDACKNDSEGTKAKNDDDVINDDSVDKTATSVNQNVKIVPGNTHKTSEDHALILNVHNKLALTADQSHQRGLQTTNFTSDDSDGQLTNRKVPEVLESTGMNTSSTANVSDERGNKAENGQAGGIHNENIPSVPQSRPLTMTYDSSQTKSRKKNKKKKRKRKSKTEVHVYVHVLRENEHLANLQSKCEESLKF